MLALAAVVLAVFAASASARASGADPRVCVWPGLPASKLPAYCGAVAAVHALRGYMAGHDHVGAWDAVIFCAGSPAKLRWHCTFHDEIEKGAAIVTYSPKPAFRPTVKLTMYVKLQRCEPMNPTGPGC